MQGVVTLGGRQLAVRVGAGFAVLRLRAPPFIESPPSKTTLPPENVTVVPLPMDRPPLQSTHQLPATVVVPDGLQLWPVVVHRW